MSLSNAVTAKNRTVLWPAMDGVRAISIALVLGVHAAFLEVQGGIVGVDVFFVLSGFLITRILLGEWDRHGRISLRNFYARRALRLYPAMLCAIGVSLVVIHAGRAHGLEQLTLSGLPWVLLYVGDIARALNQVNELGLLQTTWSLAVEEQFYLIWPFVCMSLVSRGYRRDRIAIVLVGLAAVAMLYRIALLHTGSSILRIAFAPDTRCDGLLLGCALAFWLASDRGQSVALRGRLLLHTATLVGIVATGWTVYKGNGGPPTLGFGIPTAVCTTVLLIATIVSQPMRWLNRLLELPPLTWLGRRSYGVYMLHVPIFIAVEANGGPYLRRLLGVVLSLVAAELSWRFWEEPWLRLKHRFNQSPPAPEGAVALADVGAARRGRTTGR